VLADGKQARFLFLPDGEDPDDAIRARGRETFEAMVEDAMPLSDFMLTELSRRSPPSSAEGRAALVAAAKPLLASLQAPILAALLRRRLAEIARLPERELSSLLPVAADAPLRSAQPTSPARAAPSLLRGLIKCVLTEPELIRKVEVPQPSDGDPESAALSALVEFCAGSGTPLTTPGVMQHFSGSPHESVLVAALTAAETEGLSGEAVETQLLEGVRHYWTLRQKRSGPDEDTASPVELSPEEVERARQRRLVQSRLTGGP
jgi:DNA primase